MTEISVSHVVKNFGFENVLDDLNIDILKGDRVAIVGSNGSGKTTLFRLIMGLENPNSGNISLRKDIKIGFLEQIPPKYKDNLLVSEILDSAFEKLNVIEKKLRFVEKEMSENKNVDNNMKKYSRLHEEFVSNNGYIKEAELGKICDVFKITELLNQRFSTLSGGEQTKIHLAYLLLKKPDVLLLDEPTNHLDIEMIDWLEKYLKRYNGTIVLISHDRYFLDEVVNKIFWIKNGKARTFHGNYSNYSDQKDIDFAIETKDYKLQQKKIKSIEAAIKRYREWAQKTDNPLLHKRAKALQTRLDKMDKLSKPEIKKNIPLSFSKNDMSGKNVVVIKELYKSFDEKEILVNCNLTINYGEKVCLIGKNGSGKTTLINIILDSLKSDSGDVKVGSRVKIGYLSQHIYFDNDKINVYDEFKKHFIGDVSETRACLHKFGFVGDDIYKRLDKLSGGEKVRLILAELIQENYNFLILDEPTNHIDIETREILENALEEYNGTILFVSHDRYFIDKLADKIAYLNNGNITYYLGNYEYFKEKTS